jgi:hypothetical protein
VATIARPPIDNPAKKGKASTTGYIISIFRVFDGDDREKLERNWLYWTGIDSGLFYSLFPPARPIN